MRRRDEAAKRRDRENRRLARQLNKHLYGVQEPKRLPGAKPMPRRTVDPEDWSHPESDVRMPA